MLDANEIQPTDVLKVAHHGSRTSSTEDFDAVHPGVRDDLRGLRKQLRPPTSASCRSAHDHHTEVLRTDLNGLITIRTDGRHLSVETAEPRYH